MALVQWLDLLPFLTSCEEPSTSPKLKEQGVWMYQQDRLFVCELSLFLDPGLVLGVNERYYQVDTTDAIWKKNEVEMQNIRLLIKGVHLLDRVQSKRHLISASINQVKQDWAQTMDSLCFLEKQLKHQVTPSSWVGFSSGFQWVDNTNDLVVPLRKEMAYAVQHIDELPDDLLQRVIKLM